MDYEQARKELKNVLSNQQTVSVPKLKKLLININFTVDHTKESQEVAYLKGELKKAHKALRKRRKK